MTTIIRPVTSSPPTGEGCPDCGAVNGVQWYASTTGRDSCAVPEAGTTGRPHRRTRPSTREAA